MKRRILTIALALALCLGLAVPALAAQLPDAAGVHLTAGERRIYQAVETVLREVAAGRRTGTEFTVTFPAGELGWTAQQLGLAQIDYGAAQAAMIQSFQASLMRIFACIYANCPYETYFTDYAASRYDWKVDATASEIWLTELTCSLIVTPDYRGGSDTTVDPAKVARAAAAAANARAIVQENAGKSDYEKLWAYREAICQLTDYDFDAYAQFEAGTYAYGDSSQMINVFDGDHDTQVMCEGYAKAFKYLCDQSAFAGDVHCYLVEGEMNGEGHVWNVVRMEDGKCYITDVTTYDIGCDLGVYGDHVPLLACMNEDGANYNYKTVLYAYRENQYGLYTDGYLPISPTPYEPGHAATPTAPAFTDVRSGDWFAEPIQWAVAQNITTGTSATTFSPFNTCTEAEILTFLWRAAGSPAPNGPVASDAYYAKAAVWAEENGIVAQFQPNVPCTRAMTVEFLWKAAGRPQSAAKPAFTDLSGGADLQAAVSWAVEQGVTTGTSATTFDPNATCNRGHIVTFLYRAFAE